MTRKYINQVHVIPLKTFKPRCSPVMNNLNIFIRSKTTLIFMFRFGTITNAVCLRMPLIHVSTWQRCQAKDLPWMFPERWGRHICRKFIINRPDLRGKPNGPKYTITDEQRSRWQIILTFCYKHGVQDILRYFRIFQDFSGCFRMFQDLSRCFKIFQDASGYFRMFQDLLNVLEYFGIFWNILGCFNAIQELQGLKGDYK